MKRIFIAALVGGLLLFIWQTLSFAILDLHGNQLGYTPHQDSIMSSFDGKLKEGRYYLPMLPPGSSMDDRTKLDEKMQGKPWAMIEYHEQYHLSMGRNMFRGILVDIFMVWLLCWLLLKAGTPSLSSFVTAALVVGFLGFLNFPYTYYIWYRSPGIMMDLVDVAVGWGVTGLWLGWWFNRK